MKLAPLVLGILVFWPFCGEAAQCLSSREADAMGLRTEVLNTRYSPASEVFSDHAAVETAWTEVISSLQRADVQFGFTIYFAEDGSIDYLIYRGLPDNEAKTLCHLIEELDDYRWPLNASRPFRQCGSIIVAREGLRLALSSMKPEYCARQPVPLDATLTNVSDAPLQILVDADGTLSSFITLLLLGKGDPIQLLDPSLKGPFVSKMRVLQEGETISLGIDAAKLLLPNDMKLNDVPRTMRLAADYIIGGAPEGTWSGVVWSNPISITIANCDRGGVLNE